MHTCVKLLRLLRRLLLESSAAFLCTTPFLGTLVTGTLSQHAAFVGFLAQEGDLIL